MQTAAGLAWLAHAELPAVARQVVAVALTMIEAIDVHIHALEAELCAVARHQKGCLALQSQWGVGPLSAVAMGTGVVLQELGYLEKLAKNSS